MPRSAMKVRIEPDDDMIWFTRMKYSAPERSCTDACDASSLPA
jgi:hypothetical protein